MKKAIISLSGGLDSTSLLLHLLSEGYLVKAYSFNYGQRHSVELIRVARNCLLLNKMFPDRLLLHQIINLQDVFSDSKSALTSDTQVPEGHYAEDNMKATVVENRNAIFSSIIYGKALAWANMVKEEVVICLGVHSGDHTIYPDCTKEFRDALAYAFYIGNWNSQLVGFYTPYMQGNKTSILKDAHHSCDALKIDFRTIFKNTNTCYSPDEKGKSCGKCGSCIERIEAFINIEQEDPVHYQQEWKEVRMNALHVLNEKR